MSSTEVPITARSRLHRLPERGSQDRAAINAVLDEALICHIGFVTDSGPVVIPTIHARDGETLYLHGSPASRMLRTVKREIDVCVTVTLLDGLVLARSAFHHSMNYRSVIVFGVATEVNEPDTKLTAMRVLVEHVMPGRWDDARQPNPKEISGTTVLAVPLTEASLKTRIGHPVDDDEDMAMDIWAGILPTALQFGDLEPDPLLGPGIEPPPYLTGYRRG